jgi:hypothetical protein
MRTEGEQSVPTTRIEAGEWWGMAAGPLAWGIDLGSCYAGAPHACSTGHYYVLRVIALVCFLIALSGFVAAYSVHRRMPRTSDEHGHFLHDRAFFLSLAGMVLSLGFSVVIVAGSVPQWFLSPCA